MFALSAYQLPDGVNLGPLFRRFLEREGIPEKTIFQDRMGKAEWSRMMTGQSPLDLNKVFAWATLQQLAGFLGWVLEQKVHEAVSQKEVA